MGQFCNSHFRFVVRNFGDDEFLDYMRDSDIVEKLLTFVGDEDLSTIEFLQWNKFFGFDGFCSRFLHPEIFEVFESLFCLHDQHKSIRFLIQAMDESGSNEVSCCRKVLCFEVLIQRSDHIRVFYSSNRIGMREDSLRFVNDEIIILLYEYVQIDSRALS